MDEIVSAFITIIVEFVGEIVFQLVVEFGVESIGRFLFRYFSDHPKQHKTALGIGYLILGAGLGGISIFILPDHLIRSSFRRYLNLLVTPLIAGYIMNWRGERLRTAQKEVIGLDSFWGGYLLALGFTLARLFWANG